MASERSLGRPSEGITIVACSAAFEYTGSEAEYNGR